MTPLEIAQYNQTKLWLSYGCRSAFHFSPPLNCLGPLNCVRPHRASPHPVENRTEAHAP